MNSTLNFKPINAFVAAWDKVDRGGVWEPSAHVGTTWEPAFVAVDSLDLKQCHLSKMDVDGKELGVLQRAEMTIERFRPPLYAANDIQEVSTPLLEFAIEALGCDLYWPHALVLGESNCFGSPMTGWPPKLLVFPMVPGVPTQSGFDMQTLDRVLGAEDWWDKTL